MPQGITRAADRFAVWHEAADDDAVVPPGYDPVAPEDIVAPDGGDLTPDGAITMGGPELDEPAVVIPNSNKFKTPANGLKKLLETKVWGADESPSLGMPEHSSPNVKDWIDKHPAFAKTYFKPSYQDALKASLGDANYKKLLYHMPKEHHQALTTHVQHPAPNSNKFKTPANGLSKLLHNPETTPEHVQAWVDKHPVFAKGYLHNPNYQDAIKSVIGEANYKAWAKDLKLPSLKKTLEQKTQDAADAFAPTGLVPKTQEQFFDDHVGDAGPVGPHHNQYTDPALLEKNQPKPVQEPIQGEMSPEDQADIDAIKAEQSGFSDAGPALDDALGPPAASPPELFADWQKVFPGATAAPDQEKMQAYLSAPAGEIDPDVKAKIQAIYDKHFGQPSVPPEDQPEVDAIKQQAVAQGIKAIFPNAPGLDSMPLSAQEQLLKNWQTHLVHTPGHKDNLVKLKALYDQHFGGQAAPTAPAPDKYIALEGQPQQAAGPLPDWLDISKDGYPDWVDTDSTDQTNSYYSWLQSWEPHDLQYWAAHPDQAQKSWQYHSAEGKWLTPEDFSKVEEGGPAEPATSRLHLWNPQQAKDDWLSIWTGDQDTWENQGLDDPLTAKAYVEAILKDKSDGNYKVPEMKAWFAKYFGSGSKQDLVPLSHDYLTQQLQAADDNVWGGNTLQDFLDSSLTEKKEKLQEMIVAGEDSLANDDGIYTQGEVNIYKKLVQQLSGQPTQQQMGPSIGQQLKKIVNDYTGTLTVSNEVADAYDAKSPADLQNVIVNIKDAYPAIADQLQQAFEQHISGAAQHGPLDYDPNKVWHDWTTIFPNSVHQEKFDSPVEAEQWVHEKLNNWKNSAPDDPNTAKIKALYDKWFGQGVYEAAPAAPAGGGYFKPSLEELQALGLKGHNSLQDISSQTEEEFKNNYNIVKKGLEDGSWNYGPDDNWTKIVKYIDGAASTPAPAGGTYDPVAALAEWKTIFPNAKFPDKFNNPQDAKAWVYKNLNNPNASTLKKPQVQAFWDKWFGSGATAAPSASGYAPAASTFFKPSLDELQSVLHDLPGNFAGIIPDLDKMTPQEFKENYEFVKGQMAAGGWDYDPDAYPVNAAWTKIVKYIDSKSAPSGEEDKPAPPPPPVFVPPPFEPDAFAAAFKDIWQGSGWANSGHPAAESKNKLQSQLDNAISTYGMSEKTKQGIALYEKWFGPFTPSSSSAAPEPKGPPPPPPLAPMSPDEAYAHLVSNGNHDYQDLFTSNKFKKWFLQSPAKQLNWAKNPDLAAMAYEEAHLPPPPPPMPFKSQELNPDDLHYWASNRPVSEAAWKNFSAWWGNTKLTPEQEVGLYKQWFHKDTTPEKAGAWFQAIFEHHAEPSKGDLSLAAGLLPNWAHSTWAFGQNADKEWPVFQTWAAKDPGLPAGANIKQKLLIWNSLSPEEKQAIAENYFPAEAVDTKAVIADLAKAYPDSNWKPWQNMGQGTLKANLAMLAETGAYPGAIAAYNKYFGGNIPMPEPPKPGEKPKPPKKIPSLPVSQMPEWTQSYGSFTQDKEGAKAYTHFLRFAESIGRGPEAKGEVPDKEGYGGRPYSLMQMWNSVPAHLKAQLAQMPTLPWKDEDGFKAWVAAQPTLKDEVLAIDPNYQNQYWYSSNSMNNKSTVESLLDSETDPHKKQALLDLYQKYYGAENKPTLAEALKATDPSTDWDKYLKTTPPETVAKLLKKKIKDETDPDKFIRYCDMWSKFFTGPPGNKALSSVLGKGHTGGKPLSANQLQKLWNWKAQGDPTAPVGVYGWQEATSPYIEQQQKEWNNQGYYPRYYGWTPPWEPGSATPYVPDPALLGSSPTATYQLPATTTGPYYQKLLDSLGNFSPKSFSARDLKTLKSDSFQNWFNHATPEYQKQYADNPAIPLDDYAEFMDRGGATYGPTTGPAVPDQLFDWSSYNLLPQKGDKDVSGKSIPLPFTHNPARENYTLDAPVIPAEQPTLPLAPGQGFAPKRAPIPIYRIIPKDVLDLDAEPTRAPDNFSPKQREYFLQQQRSRLRLIDQILNGPLAKRDVKSDKAHLESWAKSHGVSAHDLNDLENELFSSQPILSEDNRWQFFKDFANKHSLSEDEMYELASQIGVGNPGQAVPEAGGNYDDPRLAQLILDYVEADGMGTHWTRSPAKAYEGIPSAGATVNAGDRRPVVMISGWWDGLGEAEGRPGAAYAPGDSSELEHTLRPKAPVWVHRVQIRDKNGDWHDLIDPGPISLWPPGRNENADGRTTKDKPSLAERLDYDFPHEKHDPKEWDTLTPGPTADEKFRQLFKQNGLLLGDSGLVKPDADYAAKWHWQGPVLSPHEREVRDKLVKAYRQWFVGRPELAVSPHNLPHWRQASVTPPAIPRGTAPEKIFALATQAGVDHPERYGLPMRMARTLRDHQPQPKAVRYAHPDSHVEVRKPPGIVTVHERYL